MKDLANWLEAGAEEYSAEVDLAATQSGGKRKKIKQAKEDKNRGFESKDKKAKKDKSEKKDKQHDKKKELKTKESQANKSKDHEGKKPNNDALFDQLADPRALEGKPPKKMKPHHPQGQNVTDAEEKNTGRHNEALPESTMPVEEGRLADVDEDECAHEGLRELVRQTLVDNGGETNLTSLEESIGNSLPQQVLDTFIVDRRTDTISLPGELVCSLLEAPSFNNAALEESYWELGQQVLVAGLDFANEDKFRELFDDLLFKRQEIQQVHAAGKRRPQSKPLGPMNEEEQRLYDAVMDACLLLQKSEDWVPMSRVLDHPIVRGRKGVIPSKMRFWEWLSERFQDDLAMVTDGVEMLLHYSGAAGKLHQSETELEAKHRQLACGVFDLLQEFAQSKRFPAADRISICDLIRMPEVSGLRIPQNSVHNVLQGMPQTFEVFKGPHGWSVRLCRNALRPPAPGAPAASKMAGVPAPRTPGMLVGRGVPSPATPWPIRAGVGVPGPKTPRPLTARGVPLPRTPFQLTRAAATHGSAPSGRGPSTSNSSGTTVNEWARHQADLFGGMNPLPHGWIRATSRSSGKIYYINQKTGATQYDLPTSPARADVGMAAVSTPNPFGISASA